MNDFKRFVSVALFVGLSTSVIAEETQDMPSKQGDYSQTTLLADGTSYGYGLHLPKNVDKRKNMPLVVALHYGWEGDAAPLNQGFEFMEWMMSPTFKNAIIIAPSSLAASWHAPANTDALLDLMDDIKETYSINDEKILLTGYSAGGFGTWAIGADHQEEFSAIMPISGAPRYMEPFDVPPETPEQMLEHLLSLQEVNAQWDIPVYVINSHADQNVPISVTTPYINGLKITQPDANITFVTLDDAAHFDVEPFLVEAKAGFKVIKQAWKKKKHCD
ncbi:MAG: prolyl oligopeptidase family serine peptidase [Psychrosphaera sp.]|nr:prolyl oligopeptidase family serine peptidase [Psychrosphaera sp.]